MNENHGNPNPIKYNIDSQTGDFTITGNIKENAMIVDEKTKMAILIFHASDEILSYGILEKAKIMVTSLNVSEKIKVMQSQAIKQKLMS